MEIKTAEIEEKPVPVSITLQWCSLQLISTVLQCALRKKGKCDETFWRIFTRGAHGVVSVLSICFMTEVVLLLAYSNFCCEYYRVPKLVEINEMLFLFLNSMYQSEHFSRVLF